MENKTDILIELKAISPLIYELEKLNVFTIPQGYFEGLPQRMLILVKEEEPGILDRLSKENGSTVPAGYFDNLADNILSRIKAKQDETTEAELKGLSPMLYSIQNENVFEVPNGYFNDLASEIVNKVKPHSAKLVVMHSRRSAFIKYAIAAVFTGVTMLGVFKLTQPASVKLDAAVLNGLQINKEHSFDQEFAKVSDEDIIKYLEANGESVDAQALANKTVDENELPSPADYLSDDKALDKYLDNINTDALKN